MGESVSESSVGLELPFSPGGSSRLHQSPFCFEPAEPHLDKPCQGGGELSDTGPTGKSLSFPTPCPQVPVYLTVPRVTSDGRQMALRSCWVNNISHHGREVQPDNCYSKTVNEARCWWILRSLVYYTTSGASTSPKQLPWVLALCLPMNHSCLGPCYPQRTQLGA